jgi:hypothetical protein
MGFVAAILLSMLVRSLFRGCLKWFVLLGLLAVIANRDPALAAKLWTLASQTFEQVREFIMSL